MGEKSQIWLVLKTIQHVKQKHNPKEPALTKGFQVLYELKVKEYSETPVYNRRKFRSECHDTAVPYIPKLKGF